jgi:hypothetical protein
LQGIFRIQFVDTDAEQFSACVDGFVDVLLKAGYVNGIEWQEDIKGNNSLTSASGENAEPRYFASLISAFSQTFFVRRMAYFWEKM